MSSSSRWLTRIPYRTLVRIFELDGFQVVRRRGDHIIMTKPSVNRPVVIKSSPRMVAVTHIRANMRTAGLSRERYFQLLEWIR